MLKKALATCALVGAITLLPSCIAGPMRLSRTWDDWVNQKYTSDSWIHGALLQNIIPVYPLVGGLMTFVDVIAVNLYYFWSEDVWDRKGTGFEHENPQGATRSVGSAF
jgi:hypothetical protein